MIVAPFSSVADSEGCVAALVLFACHGEGRGAGKRAICESY